MYNAILEKLTKIYNLQGYHTNLYRIKFLYDNIEHMFYDLKVVKKSAKQIEKFPCLAVRGEAVSVCENEQMLKLLEIDSEKTQINDLKFNFFEVTKLNKTKMDLLELKYYMKMRLKFLLNGFLSFIIVLILDCINVICFTLIAISMQSVFDVAFAYDSPYTFVQEIKNMSICLLIISIVIFIKDLYMKNYLEKIYNNFVCQYSLSKKQIDKIKEFKLNIATSINNSFHLFSLHPFTIFISGYMLYVFKKKILIYGLSIIGLMITVNIIYVLLETFKTKTSKYKDKIFKLVIYAIIVLQAMGYITLCSYMYFNDTLSIGIFLMCTIFYLMFVLPFMNLSTRLSKYLDLMDIIDQTIYVIGFYAEDSVKNVGNIIDYSIYCDNVCLDFQNKTFKIKNAVFPMNTINLIKGASNTGKTVFSNLLSGRLNDYKGKILFNKKDLKLYGKEVLEQYIILSSISYINEDITLSDFVTNGKNISENYLNNLFYMIGLSHLRNKSLLYRRDIWLTDTDILKLNLIKIILLSPYVVILDHVLCNVDENEKNKILKFLSEHKLTVIVLENELSEIGIFDNLFIINNYSLIGMEEMI